ncbi:MAG TPA: type II toxin-antitoxin system VapC family toxin [Phycisphaerae bacterium]|nr:type II toxin-antitoxin system VapC family toxin [Phycisphaerae bacterium]
MPDILVDSNVLLDVLSNDPQWSAWSSEMLEKAAENNTLVINPIIYAEVSITFDRIEDFDAAIPDTLVRRDPLPLDAAFLAGKCFLKYRKGGGQKRSPLPDFFIGAHAAVTRMPLLTRDPRRYKNYFPSVKLISPP